MAEMPPIPPGAIVCILQGPNEDGMVPPGPVPTAVSLSTEGAGDDGWVIMQVTTPVGMNFFHFQRNNAVELANLIKRAVGQIPELAVARSGLYVPGS
jgi:hypothetical protein